MGKQWTQNDHDEQVLIYIRRYIDESYQTGFTIEESLEAAQAKAENARTTDGLDDMKRDAEYYLKARWMTCKRKHLATKLAYIPLGMAATVFYEALKTVVTEPANYWFGTEWMRANPGNPNALPGGPRWVKKGAMDALGDAGSTVAKATAPNSPPFAMPPTCVHFVPHR